MRFSSYKVNSLNKSKFEEFFKKGKIQKNILTIYLKTVEIPAFSADSTNLHFWNTTKLPTLLILAVPKLHNKR